MANLSLRSYYQEIESLIEEKRYDEAIAHCRHILQTFPKCIDAYRLLGKAFLEAKRYGDAADIFQRVLSTIPDDAIAHAGMSVVREDEGNLDEAIWHLESAYEVQPSNPAIQEELRRLYGRRDGDQPAKIRLSRGALARMYVRGELFPQAIADIRAAMVEDPDRIDLQILLADIYSRTGKIADAVDQARQVMQKLPNSYEANRLLALLLAGSERAEDARACLKLVTELDPYAAHLTSLADPIDQAMDEAVTLERLEWTPVQVAEAEPEIPEEVTKAPAEVGEEIPDWMQEAGWSSAEVTPATENIATGEPLEEAGDLARADLPDWLQELNPSAVEAQAEQPDISAETESDEDVLPWLDKLFSTTMEKPAGDFVEPEIAQATGKTWEIEAGKPGAELAAEIPDWLSGSTVEPELSSESEPDAELAAEIPDWLSGSMDEPEAEEWDAEKAQAISQWLASSETEPEDENDQQAEIAGETPEWLSTPAALTAEVEDTLAKLAEDTPDWLNPAEDAEPQPELDVDTPDWLKPAELEDHDQSELSGDTPDWLKPAELEETDQSELTGETPDWLSQIEEPEITLDDTRPSLRTRSILETPIEPLANREEISFLQDDVEPLAGMPELEEAEPPAGMFTLNEAEPVAEQEGASGETPVGMDEEDAAFAWLESLAVKQGAEEALLLSPEERVEQAPEWIAAGQETTEPEPLAPAVAGAILQESETIEEAVEVEAPAVLEEISETVAPAVVDEFAEEATAQVEATGETIPELPDWLAGPEPTTAEPLEWAPPIAKPIQPIDLNQASLAELERLPGVGFRLAQQIVDHRAEHGPFQKLSDLNRVTGAEDLNLEDLGSILFLTEVAEKIQPETTAVFAPLVGEETQLAGIDGARQAINRNELDLAAGLYATLVASEDYAPAEKQEILHDVLQDLQEAVKYHPEHFGLWQTLGDAYMRTDQVKPALEAYFTAEKLLR